MKRNRHTQGRMRDFPPSSGLLRPTLAALAFAVLLAPPAHSLSVFDAIQLSRSGYSDQAIIDLIEATDSAFELEAEDLPRLKQLGVSEAVIRVMLERAVSHSEGAESGPDPSTSSQVGGGRVKESAEAHGHDGVGSPQEHAERASGQRAEALFTARSFLEESSGGHLHRAVALGGLQLLILRDEGPHASIEARAQEVVEALEAAWAAGRGAFRSGPGASGSVVTFTPEANRPVIHVLSVSPRDARSYELRSGRKVRPDLLAAYWADLLSDFWAVAQGRQPSRLRALHEGEALGVLQQALRGTAGTEGALGAAIQMLPSSTQHHLRLLAQAVPRDYEHRGGP